MQNESFVPEEQNASFSMIFFKTVQNSNFGLPKYSQFSSK